MIDLDWGANIDIRVVGDEVFTYANGSYGKVLEEGTRADLIQFFKAAVERLEHEDR